MLSFFLSILPFLRAHIQKLKLIMQTKTTKISTGKLTQAMVERFKIDGFLLVEDFFSHEELDRFGSEVDKAVRYRTVDDNRSHEDKNLYEQTFVQCMGLWEDNVPLRSLTFIKNYVLPQLTYLKLIVLGFGRIKPCTRRQEVAKLMLTWTILFGQSINQGWSPHGFLLMVVN
jgi:hypothetical protein